MDPSTKNVLLTGPPACDKTTAVLGLVKRLHDLRLAGFYTHELRVSGSRVGFEAFGLSSGERRLLAHVGSRSRHRVGRYGVEVAGLAEVVQVELSKPFGEVDVFIIDEIGRMELCCPAFVEAVPPLLDGPVPVLATVAMKGGGLIAAVKARDDVRVIEVTPENRDGLPEQLDAWVRAS